MDSGYNELGGQGRVVIVDVLDTAVVRLEDAVLPIFQAAQRSLERLLGKCIQQILESFVGACVNGVPLVYLLRR